MSRLFINIDHVATLRQARRGFQPDPVAAAVLCELGGADGITMHLREDRRHVNDEDLRRVMEMTPLPVNLEMAATDEMVAIALRTKPHRVTLVPERRAEVTTEGGLDVAGQLPAIKGVVSRLQSTGIPVSLFVDATPAQIEACQATGARFVELHTGPYSHAITDEDRQAQLSLLATAAALGRDHGLEVSAGHGLDRRNVRDIVRIPQIEDLHIGHAVISHAVFVGLERAVRELAEAIRSARSTVR
jgi:pyridoxine 5-phosphate synthase